MASNEDRKEDRVRLEVDGPIALITNDQPDKHNAFDDAMDLRLFEILGELKRLPEVRAVIWRAEGKSFSSGRDVAAIGGGGVELSHHELMARGHAGIRQVFELDVPILVAMQGWAIGASFQRALLCDIRVASDDARFMLPEVTHGVIPDTGGVARLFQICGHGVAADMVLTGRPMGAEEALHHGVVSRVVPRAQLDETVLEMANKIAAAPEPTIRVARRILGHLATPGVVASMDEEMVAQTFLKNERDR